MLVNLGNGVPSVDNGTLSASEFIIAAGLVRHAAAIRRALFDEIHTKIYNSSSVIRISSTTVLVIEIALEKIRVPLHSVTRVKSVFMSHSEGLFAAKL